MEIKNDSSNGHSPETAHPGVGRSIGELGSDVLTLAELQARLGWEDVKAALHQATGFFVMIAIAGGCILGGIALLIFGLVEMLLHFLGWEPWLTLLLLGTLTLATGAALIYYCAKRLRSFETFERSKQELACNLQWLKTVFQRSFKR